jgi:hypothetical protein
MAEFYEIYRAVLEEIGDADRLPLLEDHVAHRGTADSIRRLLERAGFEVNDPIVSTFRLRFATGTALLRHSFVRLGFVPGWREVADPSNVSATFETLERRLNEAAARRGELALTVPTALFVARRP